MAEDARAHELEEVFAGDTVTIENTQEEEISISIATSDGTHLDMGLVSGQMIEFTAGGLPAKIVLHHGDPSGLLIIQPETPG